MTEFESRCLQDGATDRRTELNPRDTRALTEKMAVLLEGGDIYTVVGQNGGGEYTVDLHEGQCTCPDAQYNLDGNEACKHELRARYAIGDRPIPTWADTEAVDAQLGTHVNGEPERVAADGGTKIVIAGDEGEVLEDDVDEDGRPDECNCGDWNADTEPPCWPCYRDGFDVPNPSAGEE
jgi:predicted nucleic acid-binding Zn finger protein